MKTKHIVGGILGGVIGGAVGTALIPAMQAFDAIAPISYTTTGAVFCISVGAMLTKDQTLKAGILGGLCSLVGCVALIPFSSYLMAARPLTTPISFALTGAGIGILMANSYRPKTHHSKEKQNG
jgi:hypothetical protein